GIAAESLGFDVTKSQDHQKAYEYFAKKYGRLDILVNNAGVLKENQISAAGSGPNPVSAVSSETLRETFETNFFAPVALTQKLLPLINKAPAGRIVNVSSILSSLTLHSDPNSPHLPMTARAAVSSISASLFRGKITNERNKNEKRKTKWKSCGSNGSVERNWRGHSERVRGARCVRGR